MNRPPGDLATNELRQRLLGETALAPWTELQRFFAGGKVLAAQRSLDLIDVAIAFAEDNSERVQGWLQSGEVAPVTDDEARHWFEADAELWTVVVKPWLLVQTQEEDRAGPES